MQTSDVIPKQIVSPIRDNNFSSKAEDNPCKECSSPCCRVLLVPHPIPSTFMDLDYIRYLLGFPTVQMILNSDGQWQVLIEQTCCLLDQETNLCTVHNTPRKPKTCVFFNPYQCWYRHSFNKKGNHPELIRIDLEAFENILIHIRFDEDDNIVEIPTWEFIRDLVYKSKSEHRASGDTLSLEHSYQDRSCQ